MYRKSAILTGLVGIVMFLSVVQGVQAGSSRGGRVDAASRNLGRGISNVVFSPFEIFDSVYNIQKEEGETAAITYGVIQGVTRTVTRIWVGSFEIVTFPVGRDPMIGPEFPVRGGVVNKLFQPEKRTEFTTPGHWQFDPSGI